MPVLCIRRTNVSSWDFVAYVCFRPMFNPEMLLHPLVTKSAGVVRRRLNATRTVASIDFLRLLGGMVNCVRKVHSGVNLYRDMGLGVYESGLGRAPAGVNRQLLGRLLSRG